MRLSKTRFVPVVAVLVAAVLFCGAVRSSGQTVPPATKEEEAKLLNVLKSAAPQKDKVDACRQLGVIGTKDAVPVLAAMLADEKLSHNARYALEPIPDPSVDDALRDALGKVKGRLLVGVIGSIGVRRDAKATDALAKLLKDADADVAQAAARALGKIGTAAAAKPIQDALAGVPAGNQVAFCEGLLRAAEAMRARAELDAALGIYRQLGSLKDAPHQVRTAAIRGTLLSGGEAAMREYLQSPDYAVFAAAVATARRNAGRRRDGHVDGRPGEAAGRPADSRDGDAGQARRSGGGARDVGGCQGRREARAVGGHPHPAADQGPASRGPDDDGR